MNEKITAPVRWVRQRLLHITALVESTIAVGVGFQVINWTAEQTGLVMALVAGVLNLVAYADQRSLTDAVGLYELDRVNRDEAESEGRRRQQQLVADRS